MASQEHVYELVTYAEKSPAVADEIQDGAMVIGTRTLKLSSLILPIIGISLLLSILPGCSGKGTVERRACEVAGISAYEITESASVNLQDCTILDYMGACEAASIRHQTTCKDHCKHEPKITDGKPTGEICVGISEPAISEPFDRNLHCSGYVATCVVTGPCECDP